MKSKKGFTLIELILYIGLVTIMLSAIIPFAWDVIRGGVKSSIQQEISAQGRSISETIKYEIRNATGINSVSATSISLIKSEAEANPTVISLLSGNINITKGTNPTINLNSSDTTISNLTFTNYTSSDNKTKHIQFNFTISSNPSQTSQEYQQSSTLEGSAEVRSN